MRFDIDSYREIADSLTRNKTRSFLTGFGVFWGLFMLLFLLGGGQGFKQMLMNNFEGFANNVAFLIPNNTSRPYKGYKQGRSWYFNMNDVDKIKQQVPGTQLVTPVVFAGYNINITCNGLSYSEGAVNGVRADYGGVMLASLKYGRYLNEMDILQERKVCVIGKQVYETLFPDGGDPCGQRIKIGSTYFTIIGVDVRVSMVSVNAPAQQTILIPINVAQKIFRRNSKDVDVIAVCAVDEIKTSELEPQIRKVIARHKSLDPNDKQALALLNMEEMFNLVNNLFTGLNFLIILIGLGTILAGAIGVSNIMLVSVKERTIEIGIRRAIGATPRDILSQIIAEGVALTTVSGMSAIVFTVLILSVLEKGISAAQGTFIPFQINFWPAVAAAFGVIVIGVLAALAPASRAMRIKPVDAMRDE